MWTACVGAITPSIETCDGRDQDCDGLVDETLTRASPVVTVARGTAPGFTHAASSPFAVAGIDGESIVFWQGVDTQKDYEFRTQYMQRVAASGAPLGEAVTLIAASTFSMGNLVATAFSRDGSLVVVIASNQETDWPALSVSVHNLSDLSTVHTSRIVRTNGPPYSDEYVSFGDLHAAALDSRDAVISLSFSGSTYTFTTAWNPPDASPVMAPLPTPIGMGFEGVDVWESGTRDGTWIAYGDGTNVRVAKLNGSGVPGESSSIGAGRHPILRDSGGRLGVLYIDDADHARFTSLSMSSPPVQGDQLDLGPVRSVDPRRALALTGFQTREQWWIARVGPETPARVWMHDVVPDGDGYRDGELAFDPGAAGARGVAASVVNERSVLTFTGDATLRASAYGCL